MERGNQATKLSPSEAERKIDLIVTEGIVELSGHCRKESMPKRSVTSGDIEHTLRTGRIIRDPVWDEDHEQWKYTVEGRDIDGDKLRVVTVIFDETFSLLVITVY